MNTRRYTAFSQKPRFIIKLIKGHKRVIKSGIIFDIEIYNPSPLRTWTSGNENNFQNIKR
jgi:hypothetical protein